MRCPACGRASPVGAPECIHCGLSLVAPTAESDQGETSQGETQDWLSQLRAVVSASTEDENTTAAKEEGEGAEAEPEEPFVFPGWLPPSGPPEDVIPPPVQPESPNFDFDELPAWMQQLPSRSDQDTEIPDWLRQIRAGAMLSELEPESVVEEPLLPPEREPVEAESELPAWLLAEAEAETLLLPEDESVSDGELLTWMLEGADRAPVENVNYPVQSSDQPSQEGAEVPVSEGEGTPPPLSEEPTSQIELPTWLLEEAGLEAPPVETAEALSPPQGELVPPLEAELPAWLLEEAGFEEAQPSEAEGMQPSTSEIPATQKTEPPAVWPPEQTGTEIPPFEAVVPPGEPQAIEEIAASVVSETPDWLREVIETMPGMEAGPVAEPGQVEEATVSEVPDWLTALSAVGEGQLDRAGMDTEAARAGVEISPVPPPADETEVLSIEDAWLAELETELPQPVDLERSTDERIVLPPAEPSVAETVEPTSRGLTAGLEELYSLAFEGTAPAAGEAGKPEDLFQGMELALPVAPMTPPPRYRPPAPGEPSQDTLARAQLLMNLISVPPELTRVEGRTVVSPADIRWQRLVVVCIVLLAVIGALIMPYWARSLLPMVQLPSALPPADGAHRAIEEVQPGETVWVAFEYGSAEMDEMNVVAEPVLRHVLERGAHLVVVSSRPEGQLIGALLLDRLVESSGTIEGKQPTYELLVGGYRPGEALGIAALVKKAPSARLVLVLAGQPAPLRWWIEQGQAQGAGQPFVAVTSAAVEPVAMPYLDVAAGQLAGAVSGLSGATYYEQVLRHAPGRASFATVALAAGHLSVVSLLVLGAFIFAVRGAFRSKT